MGLELLEEIATPRSRSMLLGAATEQRVSIGSESSTLGVIPCYDIRGRGENELDVYIEIGPKAVHST